MATNQMTAMKTSDQRRDKIDYCMIYAAMFTIFLGAALIQRCLPQRWRSHPCDRLGRKSLFDEVRCATRDMMPFAFMG